MTATGGISALAVAPTAFTADPAAAALTARAVAVSLRVGFVKPVPKMGLLGGSGLAATARLAHAVRVTVYRRGGRGASRVLYTGGGAHRGC
eukprot:scaffold24691_cov67-Isochrysis_galbana.AAC.1